jgi:glycerol-3-phosphate acyltransferase PlsY
MGIPRLTGARGYAEEEQPIMTLLLAVALVLSYLLGSIPSAYLVGRANGVDLRTVGSGNLGATNVFRTLGWRWGLLVYVADLLKGVVPVIVLPTFAGVARGWPWGVVFGVLAIVGHVRPIFLLGKGGGKGVATASGVFLALAPLAALAACIAFIVTVAVSRYVSLGSLVGALVLPVVLLVQEQTFSPLVWVSTAVGAFVFYTHRANIGRLRRGEESKLGKRGSVTA